MANLTQACEYNDIDKVKFILKNNFQINPNFQNKYGDTVLTLASCNGNTEIVKLLLQYENYSERINLNIQNKYGTTALIYASLNDHTEIVKLLLQYKNYNERINPNLHDNRGNTALFYTFYNGYTEIKKLLKSYIYFRVNIDIFIPSYNILLSILINKRCKHTFTLPNEIILLIKNYGEEICGKDLY